MSDLSVGRVVFGPPTVPEGVLLVHACAVRAAEDVLADAERWRALRRMVIADGNVDAILVATTAAELDALIDARRKK